MLVDLSAVLDIARVHLTDAFASVKEANIVLDKIIDDVCDVQDERDRQALAYRQSLRRSGLKRRERVDRPNAMVSLNGKDVSSDRRLDLTS